MQIQSKPLRDSTHYSKDTLAPPTVILWRVMMIMILTTVMGKSQLKKSIIPHIRFVMCLVCSRDNHCGILRGLPFRSSWTGLKSRSAEGEVATDA